MTAKLWGTCGDIEYHTLTKSDLDGAIDVLYKSFFLNERVCNGTGINEPDAEPARRELEDLCRDVFNDGASIVAKDKTTGKVVGVAFNKVQELPKEGEKTYFEVFLDEKCKDKRSRLLMECMIYADAQFDVMAHYKIDCLLEIMFLATLPEMGGKGIGVTLCKYSIDLAKEWKKSGKKPTIQVVVAIFTSRISQKIIKKLNFEELCRATYESMNFFMGDNFAARIGSDHPDLALVAQPI